MASMSEADFVRISVMLTTIATISHYFETLADEVGLIWTERWMLGKVLFLLTRYSNHIRTIRWVPGRQYFRDWKKKTNNV
ncbi:hypothetical protein D9611_013437 [Ephemerocybe angulata]|uniref:DUF6533 domain-containing protein n=1 Tax=Ephemerocybe angulata TaxID=980116 RepID=A0A8H5BWM3_9AGAR|nr:hypothetical protein D9611_013437 [Tulosesus angulatus]